MTMSDRSPAAGSRDPLIHLVYASGAAPGLSESEILDLSCTALSRNEDLHITGMLLYVDQSFFQVLEGPKSVVEALFAKISQDPRHRNLIKVFEDPVPRRSFPDWSIGLAFLDPERARQIPGCNDFFGPGKCLHRLDPSTTKNLLEAFKDGSWRSATGTASLQGDPAQTEGDAGMNLIADSRFIVDQSDLST